MTTSGVVKGSDLPTEKNPEAEKAGIAKLLFGFTGLYERWKNEYESRRYPDPPDPGHLDPDYSRRLRQLEGQIEDIARDHEPGFRMNGNYTEGNGKQSWKDWILGIVGLLIVGWLARISVQMEDFQEIKAEQRLMEKHLESTDTRVDRLENKVYRDNP